MTSSGSRERTLAAVAAQPSPTRGEARRYAAAVMALALGASVLVFVFAGGVRAGDRPLLLVAGTFGGALVLATIAAWGALSRGGSMLGRPRRVLALLIAGVPLALFAWKLGVSLGFEGMTRFVQDRAGWRCLRWSLLMGIGPLLALVVLRRGSEPLRPAITGAAIGVAAGAGAWAMIDLWCPVAFPLHLLLGHILPLTVLGVAGAVLGRRLLGLRG